MSWNEGYVSEVEYTFGFYRELSPIWIDFATLLRGIKHSYNPDDFTYCELACGQGLTTTILAACYPQGKFYATDYNPQHIVTARSLAEGAGLTNVTFYDDSFKEFLHRDLPQFDFICLHGIYSWISVENRRAIVNFIKEKLKPGGAVYVSYNCMPGWGAAAPMQYLLRWQGRRATGDILQKMNSALDLVSKMIEANAPYFVQNPILKTRYERYAKQDRLYLIHEYFNEHWQALYFEQVAAEMNDAKLSFVGSASILEQIDNITIAPNLMPLYNEVTNPVEKEQMKDFLTNAQFRRDLFYRGVGKLLGGQHLQQLHKQRFTLIVSLEEVKYEHTFTAGQAKLQEQIYQPIVQVLKDNILTFGELQSHSSLTGITPQNLFQAIVIFTGLGYFHPVLPLEGYKKRKAITDKFNRFVIEQSPYSAQLSFLASPTLGTGVQVNRVEQMFLLAMANQKSPVDFAWQILASQNQKMIVEGKTLETPEENITHLKKAWEQFTSNRLPLLQRLGVV
ncbi:MAG: class I SAM-dependent methyltransferase [Pseudanabaenaceae cyanobacterium SKYGB_i_bin29]|nr:class I SAM-dependent methyltransferase [Pseudanabaenaceae cyanobacterium SKYG29]MDW8421797.1 class I SAM-dependent methyltransferase [Pseudanabaenaceae cyanobacterium SKYGB_i_bin29]